MTKRVERKPRKRGRPSKFDPERGQKIMRLIMLGMTLEESARAVGVHPETILNWRKKGAAQRQSWADQPMELRPGERQIASQGARPDLDHVGSGRQKSTSFRVYQ